MRNEFIDSYARYIEDLPEYVSLKPVEENGKGSEKISQASAIVLLSLLHTSALKLSDEHKPALADRINGRLKTGMFSSMATRAHWESEDLAAAEEIGMQITEQLRGGKSLTDIHFERLIRHGAIKLVNIYCYSASKLTMEAKKAYAVSIDNTVKKSDYRLVAFKSGLIVDYTQIESWYNRFTAELKKS